MDIPDYGTLGRRVLSERIAVLEKRAEGRLMTQVEIAEKRLSEKALREVDALLAVRGTSGPALEVVRAQMASLDAAGCSRDCLNPEDILAIRALDGRVPKETPS